MTPFQAKAPSISPERKFDDKFDYTSELYREACLAGEHPT